jgi:single-strand DNA-binding protein
MADVNHVVLVGRLTRDAELKYTPSGFPISTFSLAINRRKKSGDTWVDEANFFDVDLFGKSAESLKTYLIKGKQIAVEGELRQDRWEKDGQKHSRVTISASNVQLLGGGSGTGGGNADGGGSGGAYSGGNSGGYSAPPPTGGGYTAPGSSGNGSSDFPEDIPF